MPSKRSKRWHERKRADEAVQRLKGTAPADVTEPSLRSAKAMLHQFAQELKKIEPAAQASSAVIKKAFKALASANVPKTALRRVDHVQIKVDGRELEGWSSLEFDRAKPHAERTMLSMGDLSFTIELEERFTPEEEAAQRLSGEYRRWWRALEGPYKGKLFHLKGGQ